MNGLEQILEGILADANQVASKTLDEAEQYATQVRAIAESDTATMQKDAASQADAAYHRVLVRQSSANDVLTRRILLQEKQKCITTALNKAYQTILEMSDTAYFNFLETILQAYASDISGELQLNATDLARVTPDFKKAIKKHNLTLSKTPIKIDSGFLLRYGEITENCSIQELFRVGKDRLQDVVRAVLFPQENADERK